MKRLLLSVFALLAFTSLGFAAKDTVILHPGDLVYARFEVKGTKIRLAQFGKEQDPQAQVIFTFDKQAKGLVRTLKVENKFSDDLVYKIEMRSLTLKHERRGNPTPVVGGKVAFDDYPTPVEELALFDFKLEP